ncbi:MAG: DUF4440 domain-containing protein [Gemmatimonadota bacterium]
MVKLRIREALLAFVLVLSCGLMSPLHSQVAQDDTAVREMWAAFEDLFQQGDSEGIGRMYTEDADRRNGQAIFASGRAEVQQMYEDIFVARPTRQEPFDQRTRFEYDVRFLRPDVALVDGFYIQPSGARGPFTVVATREDGTWMMAAGRAGPTID